jgi:3-dehydroquinate synthase
LSSFGFELWSPHLSEHLDDQSHQNNVFRGLREFREHLGGQLTIAMLRGVGAGFDVHEIDESVMRRAMEQLETEAATLAETESPTCDCAALEVAA